MSQTPQETAPAAVQCPASADPSVRMFIVAAMVIGFAVWCYIDSGNYPVPAGSDPDYVNKMANHVLNNYGPFVFGPLGLASLVWGVVTLRRRLVADEEGIGYLGKDKLAWGRITRIDAGKLKGKGILVLHYGKGRKLVLDSWKLKNFRELVAFVERHVKPELLSTGKS